MRKYTQKAIKALVRSGAAVDITNNSFDENKRLYQSHSLETVGLSTGIYGMNAALLQDENGTLYAITARNSTLFQLV